jgi:hypothetical protein
MAGCETRIEMTQDTMKEIEVNRRGLAHLLAEAEHEPEVDPVRAAEHELIDAYADAHAIEYDEAFRRLVAEGRIGR